MRSDNHWRLGAGRRTVDPGHPSTFTLVHAARARYSAARRRPIANRAVDRASACDARRGQHHHGLAAGEWQPVCGSTMSETAWPGRAVAEQDRLRSTSSRRPIGPARVVGRMAQIGDPRRPSACPGCVGAGRPTARIELLPALSRARVDAVARREVLLPDRGQSLCRCLPDRWPLRPTRIARFARRYRAADAECCRRWPTDAPRRP